MTQHEVAANLHNSIVALFPTANVNGRVGNLLGPCIRLTYTSKTAAENSNGILENDPAFMSFHVHVERDGKCIIEFPATHSRKLFNEHGLKFRKLSGSSEAEVCAKLVKWFDKNKEIIGIYNR